jgi:uncharacterized protein YodC (DUF2158 family)
MTDIPFKAGDVVKVKSGGPDMTVTQAGERAMTGEPTVWCVWFDGRRRWMTRSRQKLWKRSSRDRSRPPRESDQHRSKPYPAGCLSCAPRLPLMHPPPLMRAASCSSTARRRRSVLRRRIERAL